MSVMDGQAKGIASLLTLHYLAMMDVEKSNPSRGSQVALSGQREQTTLYWKRTFHFGLFCAKNVTVSSCSMLNAKCTREENPKEKVKCPVRVSIGWVMFRSYKTC